MRIAIVTQTYKPPLNGQGVFAIHLAEGLARAGNRVLVVAPAQGPADRSAEQGGVQVEPIPSLPLWPIDSQVRVTPLPGRAVRRALTAFRPNVVHLQDHYPLCYSAARTARAAGLPLVATNHFLPENVVDEVGLFRHFPARVEPLLWKWVLRTFRHAGLVTAPSETAAAILRRKGLHAPVQAISNGVDTAFFRPDPGVDRDAVRLSYGLDPDRALFLYVGRIAPEKRLDVLIRAFEQLDREDVQLAIAGRGPCIHQVSLETNPSIQGRYPVPGGRVVCIGYVDQESLPALLNSTDVFAMPSEAELQSIATLEAMATGRPVVASDAWALPELVAPGVNGCLFRAGSVAGAVRCLQTMLDRREAWPAMGAASRSAAEPHDLAYTIRRYEAAYRSLLK